MEKLTVTGFAGLKEVIFEPKRITVLIGPQASGKSVLAKLTYYFRDVWRELLFPSESSNSTFEDKIESAKATFRRYFPPDAWGKKVFSIQYELNGHKLILRRSPSRGRPSEGLILTIPEVVHSLVKEQQAELGDAKKNIKRIRGRHATLYAAWRSTQERLKKCLGSNYYSGQLFIPASRAFFSNVENNVFSFIARSEKMLDPFIAKFGESYSFMKLDLIEDGDVKLDLSFLSKAMNGKFLVDKEQEFIAMSDGRRVPVSNLSSGQQELLPLILGLALPSWFMDLSASTALYIEEPEAHLFPEFQKLVLDHITFIMGRPDSFHSLIMTTHSPYLLSALNNQILAASIGKRSRGSKRARVEAIVPKQYWLHSEDVAAYALGAGGSVSIIDDETGLIDARYIDSVSTSIASVFDDLLELI